MIGPRLCLWMGGGWRRTRSRVWGRGCWGRSCGRRGSGLCLCRVPCVRLFVVFCGTLSMRCLCRSEVVVGIVRWWCLSRVLCALGMRVWRGGLCDRRRRWRGRFALSTSWRILVLLRVVVWGTVCTSRKVHSSSCYKAERGCWKAWQVALAVWICELLSTQLQAPDLTVAVDRTSSGASSSI